MALGGVEMGSDIAQVNHAAGKAAVVVLQEHPIEYEATQRAEDEAHYLTAAERGSQ